MSNRGCGGPLPRPKAAETTQRIHCGRTGGSSKVLLVGRMVISLSMPCNSAREVTNLEPEVCLLPTQRSALCTSNWSRCRLAQIFWETKGCDFRYNYIRCYSTIKHMTVRSIAVVTLFKRSTTSECLCRPPRCALTPAGGRSMFSCQEAHQVKLLSQSLLAA